MSSGGWVPQASLFIFGAVSAKKDGRQGKISTVLFLLFGVLVRLLAGSVSMTIGIAGTILTKSLWEYYEKSRRCRVASEGGMANAAERLAKQGEQEELAREDEQEALGSLTADPLMWPDQWPMLERPRNPQEFGEVVLAVSQTRAGRLFLNELVVGFLLASAPDITAERHQGQADVVRYLLQHLGLGLSRAQGSPKNDEYFNPWR